VQACQVSASPSSRSAAKYRFIRRVSFSVSEYKRDAFRLSRISAVLTRRAILLPLARRTEATWTASLSPSGFVTRISLTTRQATGVWFFGLYGSAAALATTLKLVTAINCIGIGISFQRGKHTRWQLVANDGTGAPTLTDMGASFGIATGGVLTILIAGPPNGGSVWVRVVDEVSGAVLEQEIAADLPANTEFLSPRLYLNTGATAAAVAYNSTRV
jgi:hypothetical protein